MRTGLAIVALAILGLGSASAQSGAALHDKALAQMAETHGGAVFRALDKVTARVTTLYAPLDVAVPYGSLRLTVRKCKQRPPEETPERAVFVEIDEQQKPDAERRRLFTGWMFWSSPALNALEHPVYDVWLLECRLSPSEKSALEAAAPAATITEDPTVSGGEDAEPAPEVPPPLLPEGAQPIDEPPAADEQPAPDQPYAD